jgi:hypothetical protein
MGELYNAERIVEYCQWFQRRKADEYGLLDEENTFQSNVSVHGSNIPDISFLSTHPM